MGEAEDDDTEHKLHQLVLIQNEKTKLTATAANNTAVTLFAGGVALPIVALSLPLSTAPSVGQLTGITLSAWAFVAMAIHWWARSILNGLR